MAAMRRICFSFSINEASRSAISMSYSFCIASRGAASTPRAASIIMASSGLSDRLPSSFPRCGGGPHAFLRCHFLCCLSVAYDVLAYPRHLPVICLIQASKCILVALSPSFYEFFYVHRKHTASIDIDTIFSKRLHGFNHFFTIQTAAISKKGGQLCLEQVF